METLAACLGLGPPSSGHWGPRPLIYWAALKMGGGIEQVTAPELGNEAQNEGLSASGRALGGGVAAMLLEWSCQHAKNNTRGLIGPLCDTSW